MKDGYADKSHAIKKSVKTTKPVAMIKDKVVKNAKVPGKKK